MTSSIPASEIARIAEPLEGIADAAQWKGRIISVYDASSGRLPYFIFQPAMAAPGVAPVMAIHGWTRNAAEHAFRLASYAEEKGAVLIAPLFSKSAHKHYQRLELREGETCPADALDRMLIDVSHRFGIDTSQINLFGFSGGAQFAHRYSLMRPSRVNRLVLMAAGWFTMPDLKAAYPLGLAPSKVLADRPLDIDGLLARPTRVLVGGRDIDRDASLKTGKRIDKVQGYTRVERARNWTSAMQDAAKTRGIEADIDFHIIKKAKHDFGRCVQKYQLGDLVFDWLIPNQEGAE